jgi:hypothetical protein
MQKDEHRGGKVLLEVKGLRSSAELVYLKPVAIGEPNANSVSAKTSTA